MSLTQEATRMDDATAWTCENCGVRATRMPGFGTGRPQGWTNKGGEITCLLCRRAEAGVRGVEAAGPATGEKMVRIRTASVIEFELERDAERSNSVIANVCHTSVPTVVKVRNELGFPAAPAPKARSRSKS